MKPAIFFDRDGVINIDTHYLHKIEDFEFTPNVIDCLKDVSQSYSLFIITNQSGIGRGYFSEKQYETLTNWLIKELKQNAIHIQDIYHCPHSPEENCKCRKPKPELIYKAKETYNIDLSKSWMVGDKLSDLECGYNAGIPNLVFFNNGLNPLPKTPPFDYVSTDNMKTLSRTILSKGTT